MFTKWWRRQRQTIRASERLWVPTRSAGRRWRGGAEINISEVAASPCMRLARKRQPRGRRGGKENEASQQKKKKKTKSAGNVSSPDAISLEQGGNAFSVCTGRGKELKGKCRILKQKCAGEEGDLYIKLVKAVAAGRALCPDSLPVGDLH